ncbi:hypothetical protein [Mycobacteroides abscessus]|nr:hypothetical protein [Mycobacteroides abscessus]SKP55508.1 Uncharacterised protein [Mycobacteroides abscessus subsp. abscessus]
MTGDELYEHADELALEAVVGEYPELPPSLVLPAWLLLPTRWA